MTVHPRGEEVRLIFVERGDQGSEFGRWSRRESSSLTLGRSDDPGESDGTDKGDDGRDDKGERADAADIAERVSRVFDRGMLFVTEVGFANPSCAVEEEWKPTWKGVNKMAMCVRGNLLPIHAQNWIQQMACIRSGRCHVVLRILLTVFKAPDLESLSLQ